MTFPAELSRLSAAATQGEWLIFDGYDGSVGGIQCANDGGFSLHLSMPNRAANMQLIALLANHRWKMLALVEAAQEVAKHEFHGGPIPRLAAALVALDQEIGG